MNFKQTACLLAALLCSTLTACGPSQEELYAQANQFFIQEKYPEALPVYEKLHLKDSSDLNVIAKLCVVYYYNRKFDKSIEFCEKALKPPKKKMDLLIVYEALAKSYISKGKNAKAVPYYQIMTERFPDQLTLQDEFGYLYMQMKQFDKAAQVYESLVKAKPKREYLYSAGVAYAAARDDKTAETFFAKVLKDHPNETEVNFSMGALQERKGNKKDAIKYFDKTLVRRPEHLSALFNIARLKGEVNAPNAEQVRAWEAYLKVAKNKPNQEKFIKKAETALQKLGHKNG